MNKQPEPPQGINILSHLCPLNSFEMFTGHGFLTAENWTVGVNGTGGAAETETEAEEAWTIIKNQA